MAASLAYVSQSSTTGGNTLVQAGVAGVTWNLTSLDISFSGPGFGGGGKVTIYDGTVLGNVLFAMFLTSQVGSVNVDQKIPLPTDALGRTGVQAAPGNAMTIVVSGLGANQSIVNARFTDGLP